MPVSNLNLVFAIKIEYLHLLGILFLCLVDATACLKAFQDGFSNATGANQQLMMVNTVSVNEQ